MTQKCITCGDTSRVIDDGGRCRYCGWDCRKKRFPKSFDRKGTIASETDRMKTYLGDDVYAQWDGWHVVLTTEDGRGEASNRIALEPAVLAMLEKYVATVRERLAQLLEKRLANE